MSTSTHGGLRPGRRRFTLIGYLIRVAKLLPPSVLRKAFGSAVSSGTLPDVPDLVRMTEAAGRFPSLGPSDAELFAHDPNLAAVVVTELALPSPHGAVASRLYRRRDRSDEGAGAALVWVHGGAFIGGDLTGAEAHWVGLALAARGIPVLSVTYRMALHGSRFPDASDDVLTAWTWAVEHASELGVSPDRLHLGGASAGGNLAAGVAKRLRDGAGLSPTSLVLAYPLLHPELPDWDPAELRRVEESEAPLFTPEWIRDLSLHYVGSREALADPYAFAGNGDVAGLPPTLVFNCELDTLRSSGEAFARQLAAADVEVQLETVAGVVHGSLAEPLTDAGPASLALMATWLASERFVSQPS